MKISLIILLTILFGFQDLFSERTYPLYLHDFRQLNDGESIFSNHSKSIDSIFIYQLKYDFIRGNEVITISSIDSIKNKTGIIINNTKIYCKTHLGHNLLILTQETEGLYILVINPSGKIVSKNLINKDKTQIDSDNCEIISIINEISYLLKINDKFYQLEFSGTELVKFQTVNLVNGNLLELDNSSGLNIVKFAVLEEVNTGLIIHFYSHNFELKFNTKVVLYNYKKWIDLGTSLALLTSPDGSQSLIQIIEKQTGLISSTFWLNTQPKLISIKPNGKLFNLSYIETSSDAYIYSKSSINPENPKIIPESIVLPNNLINPLHLSSVNKYDLLIFSNYIFLFDENLDIIAKQFYPISQNLNEIESVKNINGNIYILSSPNSLVFNYQENEYWLLKRIYEDFKNYLIPIILSLILFFVFQSYRHQRRYVNELLELPNIGLLFVVDSVGRLIRLNNPAKEYLEINNNLPKRKLFCFYAKSPKTLPFVKIVESTLDKKESINQKITISTDGADIEWLCKTIPVRNITGMFRGVVLSAVDITEQLERKRLSNWAQLAHDMQTNLSTIKLNAEHLDIELSDNNKSRQKRIVFQVSLLMQRVRDIVTVGRNDTLNIETFSVSEICAEVINEFDELMFPDVEFVLNCQNFLIQCDKPKLIRALRNAAENGVKSLKGKPGKICIKTWQENHFAVISISDNGIGMDEDTKKKMLTPYFTTAARTGGSGIGTMIMQHVTELHGGHIVVNSEKGIGTEVIFYIPNSLSNKKR